MTLTWWRCYNIAYSVTKQAMEVSYEIVSRLILTPDPAVQVQTIVCGDLDMKALPDYVDSVTKPGQSS